MLKSKSSLCFVIGFIDILWNQFEQCLFWHNNIGGDLVNFEGEILYLRYNLLLNILGGNLRILFWYPLATLKWTLSLSQLRITKLSWLLTIVNVSVTAGYPSL